MRTSRRCAPGFMRRRWGVPVWPQAGIFACCWSATLKDWTRSAPLPWRAADSFALRHFLGLELPEAPPDHSTISRTRRLIDLETHRAVFTWILQRLADAGLVKGQTIGIDATTLEATAALRSIVRRDTGDTYQEFLTQLAQASGIETADAREPGADRSEAGEEGLER
jgi:hypothetical protein